MINSISMFKTAKPYSPAFEAKGKINYEYERVSADSFDKCFKVPQELKESSFIKAAVKKAKQEMISDLLANGRIVKDDDGFLLMDRLEKVTVKPGDDEIPDDLVIPGAEEIEVSNVELNSIKGKNVTLSGKTKVNNVEAQDLILQYKSEVTGLAQVSGHMIMSIDSVAKDVEAKRLEIHNCSKITGKASVLEDMQLCGNSTANDVKAKNLTMQENSRITGVADVSELMQMADKSTANDVKAENLLLFSEAEITGKADISDRTEMYKSSKAKEINTKMLAIYHYAQVALANCESFADNRVSDFAKMHPVTGAVK